MKECLNQGTKLVQAIADKLFNLPSTEDVDGPIVKLPPPTTRLPREKHVSHGLPLFYFTFLLSYNIVLDYLLNTISSHSCLLLKVHLFCHTTHFCKGGEDTVPNKCVNRNLE